MLYNNYKYLLMYKKLIKMLRYAIFVRGKRYENKS